LHQGEIGELQGRSAVQAFIGTFVNKIDAKGRISVPASFRTVIQTRGLKAVALYPSPLGDPFLEGCGMDRIVEISEKISDAPLLNDEEEALSHLIIGLAQELDFDDGGRILLPEKFIARARLTDKGAFVGKGRTFQLWEPAALEQAQQAMMQRLAARRERSGSAAP
jgi:MraZ protein